MEGETLIFRLRKRAEIRRQISTRKSVQEGKPDRIADLLEEAAEALEWEAALKKAAVERHEVLTLRLKAVGDMAQGMNENPNKDMGDLLRFLDRIQALAQRKD